MRTANIKVSKKKIRYVLIIPCWALLVVEIKGRFREVIAFGPSFSSQV